MGDDDNNVYIKQPNGRYKKLGSLFTGFPTDGLWLVKDGSQSLMLRLSGIQEGMHPDLLRILSQKERILAKMVARRGPQWSLNEVTAALLETMAECLVEDGYARTVEEALTDGGGDMTYERS